jgi:hypothetical protein
MLRNESVQKLRRLCIEDEPVRAKGVISLTTMNGHFECRSTGEHISKGSSTEYESKGKFEIDEEVDYFTCA